MKFRSTLTVLVFCILSVEVSADKLSSIVITEKDEANKTIGELKPAYIDFRYRTNPRISVKEVVLRYSRLIQEASDPLVRIQALHRLGNLEQTYSSEFPDGLIPEDIWLIAIQSYQQVLQDHSQLENPDWILYQLARAYDLTGQTSEMEATLRQLVNQYPSSDLLAESWFRLGEVAYSDLRYRQASEAYAKVVKLTKTDLKDKARYMLGWSQFKQRDFSDATNTFMLVLRNEYRRSGVESEAAAASAINRVADSRQSMAESESFQNDLRGDVEEDTLRVLSILAAYQGGAASLAQAVERHGLTPRADRLYSRLYRHYLEKERYQDAAEVAEFFIQNYPARPERAKFHQYKVAAYTEGRLFDLALLEKERAIDAMGTESNYWKSQPVATQNQIKSILYEYLNELGQRSYTLAEEAGDKEREVYLSQAIRYFDNMHRLFPRETASAQAAMLTGEAALQLERWEKAIDAFELAGYEYNEYTLKNEAAYAALSAYEGALKANPDDKRLRQERVEALVRFSREYEEDNRASPALLLAANEQFDSENHIQAERLALELVKLEPESEVLRGAWLVAGHAAYSMKKFAAAEHAYLQAQALYPAKSKNFRDLNENIAASIYSQGTKYEAQGNLRQALAQYQRVVAEVPQTKVRENAQYDAAMRALDLGLWQDAIGLLTDFRQRYPQSGLVAGIGEKLVVAYTRTRQHELAANELVSIGKGSSDPEVQRKGLLQAAGLYAEAGSVDKALASYRQYLDRFPRPFDAAVTAHSEVLALLGAHKSRNELEKWQNRFIQFEAKGGNARTGESRTLAASISWELLQEDKRAFDRIRLTLPLAKSLGRKRQALEALVTQLNRTQKYGIKEYATGATHLLGEAYLSLARDILESERPTSLNELEAEQYTLLLEEQAYPFEDKAIEILEHNVTLGRQGVYDEWVKQSFAALSEVMPARYNKQEVFADVPQQLR